MLTTEFVANLTAFFEREGYPRVEPPVLQPVDAFVELSGEDIRRRLFVTQDAAGADLCLRPEYTIPVCRLHLESGEPERISAASYVGPVFRHRTDESGEFPQAGFESIGRPDREAADAAVLTLAVKTTLALGVKDPIVRIGDVAILRALLAELRLSPALQRKLLRAVVSGTALSVLDGGEKPEPIDTRHGLLSAIEGQDAKAARAFVEDVLALAGISHVGGRSAGEIAERFLAKAARRDEDLTDEVRAVLMRYLAIVGDPDRSIVQMRALAAEAGLDMSSPIDAFEARTGFLAAQGVNVASLSFAAGFARNLDYYTGFIFEIFNPERPDSKPLGGGGRYDDLLSRLGAPEPVPAVGCSLWLDRFNLGAPA